MAHTLEKPVLLYRTGCQSPNIEKTLVDYPQGSSFIVFKIELKILA
jgi:hypothetical protein